MHGLVEIDRILLERGVHINMSHALILLGHLLGGLGLALRVIEVFQVHLELTFVFRSGQEGLLRDYIHLIHSIMLKSIRLVLIRVDRIVQIEIQLDRNIGVDLHAVVLRPEVILNIQLQLLG